MYASRSDSGELSVAFPLAVSHYWGLLANRSRNRPLTTRCQDKCNERKEGGPPLMEGRREIFSKQGHAFQVERI